ncbi:MAG: preprotein translocase subunit SecE [Dictyoglomus sp.]|nr:preprotein translocase subunit SecE [Dictyoglomus sp.]MCX7942753.1 preprotein translocase subunit SecE [Dictyoglomaceae bacterium]MDW8188124.1 preprotein translocase subunit SecE [Dictyoglomus sp.]
MVVKNKFTIREKIKNFWLEEKMELKKVLWPDREKVLKLSLALGVMLFFLITLIALYDFIFNFITSLILRSSGG